MTTQPGQSRRVWTCKIGYGEHLPAGADLPMREAVESAFEKLCGGPSDFLFSGWGDSLSEAERAVFEDRLPDPWVAVAEYEGLIAHYTALRDSALNYARAASAGEAKRR